MSSFPKDALRLTRMNVGYCIFECFCFDLMLWLKFQCSAPFLVHFFRFFVVRWADSFFFPFSWRRSKSEPKNRMLIVYLMISTNLDSSRTYRNNYLKFVESWLLEQLLAATWSSPWTSRVLLASLNWKPLRTSCAVHLYVQLNRWKATSAYTP